MSPHRIPGQVGEIDEAEWADNVRDRISAELIPGQDVMDNLMPFQVTDTVGIQAAGTPAPGANMTWDSVEFAGSGFAALNADTFSIDILRGGNFAVSFYVYSNLAVGSGFNTCSYSLWHNPGGGGYVVVPGMVGSTMHLGVGPGIGDGQCSVSRTMALAAGDQIKLMSLLTSGTATNGVYTGPYTACVRILRQR